MRPIAGLGRSGEVLPGSAQQPWSGGHQITSLAGLASACLLHTQTGVAGAGLPPTHAFCRAGSQDQSPPAGRTWKKTSSIPCDRRNGRLYLRS